MKSFTKEVPSTTKEVIYHCEKCSFSSNSRYLVARCENSHLAVRDTYINDKRFLYFRCSKDAALWAENSGYLINVSVREEPCWYWLDEYPDTTPYLYHDGFFTRQENRIAEIKEENKAVEDGLKEVTPEPSDLEII